MLMLPSAPTQLLRMLSFVPDQSCFLSQKLCFESISNSLWNTANGLKGVKDFPQYCYFCSTLWWQERNGWKSELWETPVGLETGQVRITFSFLCCYTLRLAVVWKVETQVSALFTWPMCISAHILSFIRTGSWFCIFVTTYLWFQSVKALYRSCSGGQCSSFLLEQVWKMTHPSPKTDVWFWCQHIWFKLMLMLKFWAKEVCTFFYIADSSLEVPLSCIVVSLSLFMSCFELRCILRW